MIQINISNKVLFTFITILVLSLFGVIAYAQYSTPTPNPGHGADTILVSINGEEKTLQQAIDDNSISYNTPNIKKSSASHKGNFDEEEGNNDGDGYEELIEWINDNGCSGNHVCTQEEIIKYSLNNPDSLPDPGWAEGQNNCRGWTKADDSTNGLYWNGRFFELKACSNKFEVLCC